MPDERKKILCIEDDDETATLIAEELADRGYEVCVARDGRSGFAAILKQDPDLVLSDISMPGMSGFELLERVVALAPRFRHMPFVFLTALTDRESELKGRQLGADDYVTKPIDFEVLETIRRDRAALPRPLVRNLFTPAYLRCLDQLRLGDYEAAQRSAEEARLELTRAETR